MTSARVRCATPADRLLALDAALDLMLHAHGHDSLVDEALASDRGADALVVAFSGGWRTNDVLVAAFATSAATRYYADSPERLSYKHMYAGVRELVERGIVPLLPCVLALAIAYHPTLAAFTDVRSQAAMAASYLVCNRALWVDFVRYSGNSAATVAPYMNHVCADIARYVGLATCWPSDDARVNAFLNTSMRGATHWVRWHFFDERPPMFPSGVLAWYFALTHGLVTKPPDKRDDFTTYTRFAPHTFTDATFTAERGLLVEAMERVPSLALGAARRGLAVAPDVLSWAAFELRDVALVADMLRAGTFTAAYMATRTVSERGAPPMPWGEHDVRAVLAAVPPVVAPVALAHFYVLLARSAFERRTYDAGIAALVPLIARLRAAVAPDAPALERVSTDEARATFVGHERHFIERAPALFTLAYARHLLVHGPAVVECARRLCAFVDEATLARGDIECAEDVVVAALVRTPVDAAAAAPHRAAVCALVRERPVCVRALGVYGLVAPSLATLIESAAARDTNDRVPYEAVAAILARKQ